MSFPKRFARQSRTLIVAEALALLGVTAVLDLMTSYSTSGKATHLKMTAGKIAPVVQSHIDMLDKMAM